MCSMSNTTPSSLKGTEHFSLNAAIIEVPSLLYCYNKKINIQSRTCDKPFICQNGDIRKEILANQQPFVGINVFRLFGDKTNMLVKYMNMMHDAIA